MDLADSLRSVSLSGDRDWMMECALYPERKTGLFLADGLREYDSEMIKQIGKLFCESLPVDQEKPYHQVAKNLFTSSFVSMLRKMSGDSELYACIHKMDPDALWLDELETADDGIKSAALDALVGDNVPPICCVVRKIYEYTKNLTTTFMFYKHARGRTSLLLDDTRPYVGYYLECLSDYDRFNTILQSTFSFLSRQQVSLPWIEQFCCTVNERRIQQLITFIENPRTDLAIKKRYIQICAIDREYGCLNKIQRVQLAFFIEQSHSRSAVSSHYTKQSQESFLPMSVHRDVNGGCFISIKKCTRFFDPIYGGVKKITGGYWVPENRDKPCFLACKGVPNDHDHPDEAGMVRRYTVMTHEAKILQELPTESGFWDLLSSAPYTKRSGDQQIPKFAMITPMAESSLFEWLYEKRSDLEVFRVLRVLAKGIWHLHKNNRTHGDIKPENVLINSKMGRVGFIDFGYSHPFPAVKDYILPFSVGFYGTKEFTAPELLQGFVSETNYKELDVWAFGQMVFSMVHGKRPSWEEKVTASKSFSPEYDVTDAQKLTMQKAVEAEIEQPFLKLSKKTTLKWDEKARLLICKMCRYRPQDRITIDKVVDDMNEIIKELEACKKPPSPRKRFSISKRKTLASGSLKPR